MCLSCKKRSTEINKIRNNNKRGFRALLFLNNTIMKLFQFGSDSSEAVLAQFQKLITDGLNEDINIGFLLPNPSEYPVEKISLKIQKGCAKYWYWVSENENLIAIVKISQYLARFSRVSHNFEIGFLLVSIDSRGKGVWEMLMKFAMKDICSQFSDFPRINFQLSVHAWNNSAIRLYKKLNFQKFWREKNVLKLENKYFDLLHFQKVKNN